MKTYIINTVKSIIILILGSFIFVLIITIFPLLGSLTMSDFPIKQVIKENFQLMIPLSAGSFIISFILGFATQKIKKKRKLYLLIIGILACWIAIIGVMLFWTKCNINPEDLSPMFLVSIWALITYSIFFLPVLIPSILILEKWTKINKFIIDPPEKFK